MFTKRLETINKADIDNLIDSRTAEGKSIEYKRDLPGNSDQNKKEFLADVASFANAGGGDIVYGVDAERDTSGKPTGLPSVAVGLTGVNFDDVVLRLDS